MAQNILKKFASSAKQLDEMIFKLETNLGRQHTVSPFPALYQKYSVLTNNKAVAQEEIKESQPVPAKEEQKQPLPNQQQQAKKEPQPKKEQQPKGGKKGAQPVQEEVKLEERWDIFNNCDLRVGKILTCEPHPDSANLYRETIDLGEGEPRLIGSGLQGKVPLEEMTQGLVVVFANLKPRKLADFMSNGMVLCASTEDKSTIELIRPPEGSKVGERIQLTGNPILGQPVSQDPRPHLNPKKKYMERFLPQLHTNDQGQATYDGVTLETSTGILTSKTLKNVHIS